MKITKAKCEQFAKANNMTIEIDRWSAWGSWSVSYSVDLPNGMITEAGDCGRCGETDDAVMAEVWETIWSDMQHLVSYEWMTIDEYESPKAGA
jgi:hypothetical protein